MATVFVMSEFMAKAEDGGTIGAIADKADDVIDQIQGTED